MSVEDVLPTTFISKYFPQNLFPDYTLPKIDQQSLVNTGKSYIEAQKELAKELGYGEGRPTDASAIFEARQALLADYLTKPKTKEELLAEQQAFFGDDTQKDAEIQAGLALAKYGSQVAQTPGSLLQALVAPAGGLAADLSKVAATKSAVERAAKEKAYETELAQTERLRGENFQLAIDAAKTADVNENTRLDNILDITKDAMEKAQAQSIQEAALINKKVDKMVAAQLLFGGKEDLLYAKKDESTGKYKIIRVRSSATGPQYLNPTTQKLEPVPEDYFPIDKSDLDTYSQAGEIDYSDADRVDLVVKDPDPLNPTGWKQVQGLWTGKEYRIFTGPTMNVNNTVSAPAGTVEGNIKDVISIADPDEAGRIMITVTNPINGSTYTYPDKIKVFDEEQDKFVYVKNPDNLAYEIKPATYKKVTKDGQVIQEYQDGNPLVYEVDPIGITANDLSGKELAKVVRKTRAHVATLRAGEELLEALKNIIGPIGTLKRIATNNIAAFIPEGELNNLMQSDKIPAYQQQLINFERTMQLSELLSDKNSVTEQAIVSQLVPQLNFAQDPKAAMIKFQEYIRSVYNRLAEQRAILHPERYGGKQFRIEKMPSGSKDDPFIFYDTGVTDPDRRTRHFDYLSLIASDNAKPANLDNLFIQFRGQDLEIILNNSAAAQQIPLSEREAIYKRDGEYIPFITLPVRQALDIMPDNTTPGDQSQVDEDVLELNKKRPEEELDTSGEIQISKLFPKNLQNNLKKPESIDALVRTIVAEAGGESEDGQLAVANVILNRFKDKRYPNDIQRIVLQPFQFSAYNDKDQGGNDLVNVSPNNPTYKKVKNIVELLLAGKLSDNTGGATHYWNPDIASPSWGNSELAVHKNRGKKIGQHLFAGTVRS